MQQFPHVYVASASAAAEAGVALDSPGLPRIESAPPAEFGGPGDRWSPETLLVASIADCFILTFRSITRASKLPWTALQCSVEGTLNRVDRVTQFTDFHVSAALEVPPGGDEEKARQTLERAEHLCLIRNSLKATFHLETQVIQTAECPQNGKPAEPAVSLPSDFLNLN